MDNAEKVSTENAEIREALAKVLQHHPDKGISDYAKEVLSERSSVDDGPGVPVVGEGRGSEGRCGDSAEKSSE
jgi:hypothetical protein